MTTGVSIVICCYNSSQRLPKTLEHLAAQKLTSDLPWEVIVVDNASTDNTAEIAKTSWSSTAVPLRVVHEHQQGLIYARHRALIEAKYDIIGFVDDDNWVCPEWVQTVAEIMTQHPNVGACGGCSSVVSDVPIPSWFERYQGDYAVGSQAPKAGEITEQGRDFLWGAGLSVRKQAWQQILDKGFEPLLVGRKGTALSASEDFEFCLALRAAGWQLWYDPRLQLQHCLPASRLQWSYLRRLKRGIGASSVGLDHYSFLESENGWSLKAKLKQNWYWRVAFSLLKLMRYPHKLLLFSHNQWEGDESILHLEILIGRLNELIKTRKVYATQTRNIREAPWRNSVNNLT
ncbi:MAG: glycosyltransferase family 2 protein [Calothrix sp. C42_A2020_038]|nr:glycosyltransferase family 2 protein [Calothrix sp. C42_A2020_038]